MTRSRTLVVASQGGLTVHRDPDRPSGRLLRQDDMDASYVDLADPRHLEFDYLRWARLILRSYRSRRVLHIGGAGCTLARALLADDAQSRQEVVELDQEVIDVARAHLGLRRQPGLRVRIGDGYKHLGTRPDGSADAIFIDAFLGARVPSHLVTPQALAECARVAPLAIVNVVDTSGWPLAHPIAAALAESFAFVGALSSSTRRSGNVVLFGARTAPPAALEGSAAADASPARLSRV